MRASAVAAVCIFAGDTLGRYHFGADHPFGPQRQEAFLRALGEQGLADQVSLRPPALADSAALRRFHTAEYVAWVAARSRSGDGYLDGGDTPAFPGVYEAAAAVAGTTLAAVDAVMTGGCRRAFVPIAGLHHARRDRAAGFCVFNDCGVAIEHLRQRHGLRRLAYVDIDAHHGDGVYEGFAEDADLRIVDFHEDGRFLYPGSGGVQETGQGAAAGTKLNIPMPPGAGDALFLRLWETAERFLREARPEFVLLQCGADGLAGDPLTDLRYSAAVHAHVARRLCALADECCAGRLVALGGGGYDPHNIGAAWGAVVAAMLEVGGRERRGGQGLADR